MENEKVIDENLEKDVEKKPKQNLRDSIYKNIDIPLKTMDKFITILLVLLGFALFLGIAL
ncbi:hypothetical protein [Clostridium sp. Ade.TY]|uniref:hypothetical protein n=1 Tax=Clostridium sp. Ade.TY TaxID=1391647 RepID=UPI0004286F87|nr:hypothetical protein [Clostridium sp. Ade.TY]